jgi:hypothetical protein
MICEEFQQSRKTSSWGSAPNTVRIIQPHPKGRPCSSFSIVHFKIQVICPAMPYRGPEAGSPRKIRLWSYPRLILNRKKSYPFTGPKKESEKNRNRDGRCPETVFIALGRLAGILGLYDLSAGLIGLFAF